jgi:antitoxin component of RelBE/YafQ-DinJ toxin-antitoxin module
MPDMTERLDIRIKPEQRAELAAVAREYGLSSSAAVRLAISKLIAEQRQQHGRAA